MISGEKIAALIKEPNQVRKEQREDISTLLAKYPYCSTLHILQLIALKKENHIDFQKNLKLAASSVSDRERLHNLVNNVEESDVLVVEKEVKAQEPVEAVPTDLESKVEEVEQLEEIENVEEVEMVEKVESSEITADKEAKEIEKKESIEVETLASVEPREELADLEPSIMSSVIESALEGKQEKVDEEAEIALPKKKKKSSAKKKKKKKAAQKKAKTQKKHLKRENMSFIEWLKYKQEVADTGEDFIEEGIDEISEAKHMSKKEINDLLDKFIEEEPKISKADKNALPTTKIASKSVEESVDIVSETLAKIHFMQGNYAKAISAYKQLSLLYPEKKAFFATQIEKIKEKQK